MASRIARLVPLRSYTTESVAKAPRVAPTNIVAGLLLSRIPIVTPEQCEFETAYYKYQDELERKLMWTFPQYYYFKRGSLKERQFNAAQRGPVPNHPGIWFSRGAPDIQHNRERRDVQHVVVPSQSNDNDGLFASGQDSDDSLGRPIVPNSRTTEADATNDTSSLSRKLDRTLYLVVSEKEGQWSFPTATPDAKEPLHTAAERVLRQLGGENINTWTVSNTPAGVVRYNTTDGTRQVVAADKASDSTMREFFIKSHILHGRFVPQTGHSFAWLTKQEIQDKLDPAYYNSVAPLLAEL